MTLTVTTVGDFKIDISWYVSTLDGTAGDLWNRNVAHRLVLASRQHVVVHVSFTRHTKNTWWACIIVLATEHGCVDINKRVERTFEVKHRAVTPERCNCRRNKKTNTLLIIIFIY